MDSDEQIDEQQSDEVRERQETVESSSRVKLRDLQTEKDPMGAAIKPDASNE